MLEVRQDIFAGRDIDADVVPLLGRNVGQTPLHQGFPGRDDLHHGGMSRLQILLDRGNDARALHRGDQVVEEALLRAFERRAGGGLGLGVERAGRRSDVGGGKGCIEVIVNDLEGGGIGIVDPYLLARQRVFEHVIFDPVERQ